MSEMKECCKKRLLRLSKKMKDLSFFVCNICDKEYMVSEEDE